ncbi:MAG TPA: adenylate/guanylate cyclase domain-containing protein, partial [Patescibacteria group bacterium]|nr:adenylate/guanylate cyclase domain-containing protein [Patescibacteria group bacterium]
MTDASDELLGTRASEPGSAGRVHSTGSLTRGFLFADLRDYTRYLESHGAVDAADLLVRYRTLVRKAVAEYDGAEIKTEGDSFYVVFQAVSAAVLCASPHRIQRTRFFDYDAHGNAGRRVREYSAEGDPP